MGNSPVLNGEICFGIRWKTEFLLNSTYSIPKKIICFVGVIFTVYYPKA